MDDLRETMGMWHGTRGKWRGSRDEWRGSRDELSQTVALLSLVVKISRDRLLGFLIATEAAPTF